MSDLHGFGVGGKLDCEQTNRNYMAGGASMWLPVSHPSVAAIAGTDAAQRPNEIPFGMVSLLCSACSGSGVSAVMVAVMTVVVPATLQW